MEAIALQLLFVFSVLIILLISGAPLAVALGGTGILGIMFLEGPAYLFNTGFVVWDILFSWSLLAIFGFVLMGCLFSEFGFGRDIYRFVSAWLGGVPGGTVISSIIMCALFGFICASAMAGISTVGKLQVPEMERLKVQRSLYSGALAFGGTLSAIIPPSIWMIIYCDLSEASLGDMFFAGIIPGLLLVALGSVYVLIRVILNPSLAPNPADKYRTQQKIAATLGVVPIALTFVVVLGGIYLGFFSAIEASAVGAFMAASCAVVFKKPNRARFATAFDSAVKICVMIYVILIGAMLFSHLMFLSGLKEFIVSGVIGLELSRFGLFVMILGIITILGCVMDVLALLVICVPIFLPIANAIGIDAVLFGVIMIILCELAEVTPPVGLNLFIIKGVLPAGTGLGTIAWSALPFVVISWVVFMLLYLWPQLALWLPSIAAAGRL